MSLDQPQPTGSPDGDPSPESTPTRKLVAVTPSEAPTGLLPSAPIERQPPPVIPGYRIIREIGRGGMGEVYEAYFEKLNVNCALKVIRRDRVSDRFLVRFNREARVMTALNHPHIARIFAYEETEDGPYFTMEYLPDGTLEKRKGPYSHRPRDAVVLMTAIADAIAHVHAKGYVHRDLKPQNILFKGDVPFVADFGLVTEQGVVVAGGDDVAASPVNGPSPARGETRGGGFSPTPHHLTARDGVIGTLPYMSPEQLQNHGPELSGACDIWALGVMLYELVCGERPFTAADDKSLSDRIRNAEKPPSLRITGVMDERLAAILSRCLAKDPGDRYPSADALVRDLKKWAAPTRTSRWLWPLPAAVLILAALPAAAPLLRPGPASEHAPSAEEERAGRQALLRRSLEAGKPFTLLGEKGWPATGVTAVLGSRPGEAQLNGGVLSIASLSSHAMQLAEDPAVEGYRYSVQVRHDPVGDRQRSRVGVYLFHGGVQAPYSKVEPYLEFSFTEQADQAQKGRGVCQLTFYARTEANDGTAVGYPNFTAMKWRQYFPQAAGDPSPWHDLGVEVRKKELRFYFDGKLVFQCPRSLPAPWVQMLAEGTASDDLFKADQTLRGGLGLIVSRGQAHFRNAKLEPVAED